MARSADPGGDRRRRLIAATEETDDVMQQGVRNEWHCGASSAALTPNYICIWAPGAGWGATSASLRTFPVSTRRWFLPILAPPAAFFAKNSCAIPCREAFPGYGILAAGLPLRC